MVGVEPWGRRPATCCFRRRGIPTAANLEVTRRCNAAHCITAQNTERLRALVDWVVAHKRRSGTIVSSTYYLEHIPQSFGGGVPGCQAGRRFLAVRLDGVVQSCHDYEVSCPYPEWTRGTFAPPNCAGCWCSGRGESETPLSWERIEFAA